MGALYSICRREEEQDAGQQIEPQRVHVSNPVAGKKFVCQSPRFCDQEPRGLRIAWSPTLGYVKATREVLDITARAARVFEELGCTVELVENIFDDPVDIWMAEFYAGVGTRLKKPLAEHREIIDPAVAGVLENALDQTVEEYYTRVFQRYEFR